jgi:hypothetical protein
MRTKCLWLLVVLAAIVLATLVVPASAQTGYKTKHVFVVVMDGVRWMDTFGDPEHQFIPHLYKDLRPLGTLFTNYYDRGITVTRQGHSTIASGTWQMVPNGGPRVTRPTFFEYLRDEKGIAPTKAWAVFGKAEYSFLPYSSHPAYGEKLACSYINGGGKDNPINEASAEGDVGVLNKVVEVMKQDQPDLMFINFGYTDHAGHIAKDILEYQEAIRNCDEQFWRLWSAIQADPYYRDTTTVFFTNDHGRHDRDFHSHGDHCPGCEHIMLLAIGPDTKPDTVVSKETLEIDIAPTVGELLGFQTPLSTGSVITEALTQYLGLNQKQAVTEAGRQAVAMEKLADRDLVRVAADRALATWKPAEVPVTLDAALLMHGMLRAHAETKDEKYLDFVRQWVDAHKSDTQALVVNVIVDMPQTVRPQYMPIAKRMAEVLLALKPEELSRLDGLLAGGALGRMKAATQEARFGEAGLTLVKAAVEKASPTVKDGLAYSRDLYALATAASPYSQEEAIRKAFTVNLFRALRGMKEQGVLWPDATASVINIASVLASQRGNLLKEYAELKAGVAFPAEIEKMTVPEATALFDGEKPAAPRRQIITTIFQRGKQGMQFSRDMLRYGVDAAGAYGDGSMLAQGGFLVAYQKLPWRYDGNTWPGTKPVSVGTVNMGPKGGDK